MEQTLFLHFLASTLAVGLSAVGIGIGQSIATNGFFEGISKQPSTFNKVSKTFLLGLFVIEGSFVLAFIIGFLILFNNNVVSEMNLAMAISELGIGLGLGITTTCIGIAAGNFVATCCKAVSRQPFYYSKMNIFMILILTLIETPLLLNFVIGLISINSMRADMSLNEGAKLFTASLTIGLGAVGPTIAQGVFAPKACKAISFDFDNYSKILGYTFITEALIETGALLSFMISVLLCLKHIDPAFDTWLTTPTLIVSGMTVAIGTIFSSTQIGKIGSIAVEGLSKNISIYNPIFRGAFFSQILIETCGLFAFIISLLILTKAAY